MITTNSSGQAISQAFVTAMAAPVVGYSMQVWANGTDTGWDVMRAQLDLGAGGSCDSDTQDLAIGGTYSTQATITVAGSPVGVPGTELELRVGVWTGSSYEWVTVAEVTATAAREWMGQTAIRASGPVASKMSVPLGLPAGRVSPSAMASAISSASGVTVTLGAFQTTSTEVSVSSSMTCREALSSLATRLGGFAAETNGGAVVVAPFSSTATFALSADVVPTMPDLASAAYVADGLTVEVPGGDPITLGTGRVRVTDEYGDAATAAAMWANLQGYTFTPGTIQVAVADPRVTPFDVASFSLAGHTGNLPTQGVSLTYDGGLFGSYWAAGLTAEQADELVQGQVGRTATEALSVATGAADEAAGAMSVAEAAEATANATGQHFWTDGSGAHVTEITREEWEDQGPTHETGANVLINSMGQLFRTGLTNLLSLMPSGIVLGSDETSQAVLTPSSFTMTNKAGQTMLALDVAGLGQANVTETAQDDGPRRAGPFSMTVAGTPVTGNRMRVHFTGNIVRSVDSSTSVLVPIDRTWVFTDDGTSRSSTYTIYSTYPSPTVTWSMSVTYDGAGTFAMVATREGRDAFLTSPAISVQYRSLSSEVPALTFGTRDGAQGVGLFSATMGEGLVADEDYQFVLGKFNEPDSTAAVIIGDGTDADNTSNSLVVGKDGSINGIPYPRPVATYTGTNDTATASANGWRLTWFNTVVQSDGHPEGFYTFYNGIITAIKTCSLLISGATYWNSGPVGQYGIGVFTGTTVGSGTEYSMINYKGTASGQFSVTMPPRLIRLNAGDSLCVGRYEIANAVYRNGEKLSVLTIEVAH